MTTKLTSTSEALLGLLSIQPWTTYELAKQVERSLGWFWPRTERKVYDEAKKLVAAGLATAKDEASGGRPRTVYRITAKGRRELARWLAEPSAPTKLEAESLVRVFFADAGGLADLRRTLRGFGREAEERLSELGDLIAAADDPDYPYEGRVHINALAIRFQMDLYRTIAGWADWAERQTEDWVDARDPGAWDWRRALDRR
ncbi:helix-turn-helix transcriptional regulator [Dermatobacter hominis]|uniref:helix-turn-helix transcriptional regulator n=1 Tax=Dermatobacter hominis TaxID=2884263 RepID=UPI001D1281B2|nr:helix-turn-helix transcriptional regulator [Dermatobacter hominis]UDY34508.1 PadR family transcriptional regulator [Dermatobacter hominis]